MTALGRSVFRIVRTEHLLAVVLIACGCSASHERTDAGGHDAAVPDFAIGLDASSATDLSTLIDAGDDAGSLDALRCVEEGSVLFAPGREIFELSASQPARHLATLPGRIMRLRAEGQFILVQSEISHVADPHLTTLSLLDRDGGTRWTLDVNVDDVNTVPLMMNARGDVVIRPNNRLGPFRSLFLEPDGTQRQMVGEENALHALSEPTADGYVLVADLVTGEFGVWSARGGSRLLSTHGQPITPPSLVAGRAVYYRFDRDGRPTHLVVENIATGAAREIPIPLRGSGCAEITTSIDSFELGEFDGDYHIHDGESGAVTSPWVGLGCTSSGAFAATVNIETEEVRDFGMPQDWTFFADTLGDAVLGWASGVDRNGNLIAQASVNESGAAAMATSSNGSEWQLLMSRPFGFPSDVPMVSNRYLNHVVRRGSVLLVENFSEVANPIETESPEADFVSEVGGRVRVLRELNGEFIAVTELPRVPVHVRPVADSRTRISMTQISPHGGCIAYVRLENPETLLLQLIDIADGATEDVWRVTVADSSMYAVAPVWRPN